MAFAKGKAIQREWDVHGTFDFEMDDFEKETVKCLKESILKHFGFGQKMESGRI